MGEKKLLVKLKPCEKILKAERTVSAAIAFC